MCVGSVAAIRLGAGTQKRARMDMSVTLVAPVAASWAPANSERASSAAIVATRATTFLRAQAQWLRRGLQHADDAVALAIVLDAHDRSHERWVAQIGATEQALGADAAQSVATAYSHLGRVAGSLEGGRMRLLDPEVAEQARKLLAARLTDVIEQTVEQLWKAAASA
jgi:hypothetical protein